MFNNFINIYLLSVTGSVVIGVLYGGPEVHVGDLAENRFIQGSARPGNRGGGGKGGSRSNTSSENNSSNLHLYYFAKTRTVRPRIIATEIQRNLIEKTGV